MVSIIITVITLILSPVFMDNSLAVYLLAAGQLALLLAVVQEKNLSGGGAFIFMSFLFFTVRPIYMLIERDNKLLVGLFQVSSTQEDLNVAMWWGTAAILFFHLGRIAARKFHVARWIAKRKFAQIQMQNFKIVSCSTIYAILCYQLVSLGIMFFLGTAGKSLYNSALGAYIYDLPSMLQAGHIFALLLTLERFLRKRSSNDFVFLCIAVLLFFTFTLEMRNISNFRGFYITGVMSGGIAVLARLKTNVRALWLILPIVLLLPAFRILGEIRYSGNAEFSEALSETLREKHSSFIDSYWQFYNSEGDMNIFDTFVAAYQSKPKNYPYLTSWLYVPVHFIPRAFWHSKPEKGILQDVGFLNGSPFSPGIAGFFLVDGGRLWMLLSMSFLGYLLSFIDMTILTMPRTYLRFSLYGIVVINALGLSRFYLWQYFYGTLYAVVPCLLIAWAIERNSRGRSHSRKKQITVATANEPL
jgi:hypothetical protein